MSHANRSPINFQMQRQNAAAFSIGQVSDEPLTWSTNTSVSVTGSSAELVAAGTGTGRTVILFVPASADTGVHIAFAEAATTSKFLIPAGGSLTLTTEQQIRAIRAGSSNVTVYALVGSV